MWFLMRLTKDEREINLANGEADPEFVEWKWELLSRAGFSSVDQFYASYPAGTELLTDTTKLYKAALGNCFESEEWGPVEFCIMARHFKRQGKSP
ncbi:uncharacterized protein LOC111282085 isoform X3 [Durio zibethinus]|uniref:Uncharacterized protein LOC111282085 isoform X3 n=1 Tax=Durio zibethinus TaxID=66656 RepID=A0A6P5XBK7_DURZI|nr:uncharacterized protein LOC111282085 isoform X3 [Durio zibethinus]XP_022725756.1 uncharacterized protein LOC111282085 isoform X3 [Durio zibethinus]